MRNSFLTDIILSYLRITTKSFGCHTSSYGMDHPGVPAWLDSNRDLTIQYKIHLGLWTDWSRGRVLGATLTLDRQQANLLIAFTASFVVFVGSRFWHIICLFLHQIYSTSDPRDALHHQRQVILRNSGTSDAGVVSSFSNSLLPYCV